MTDVSAWSSTVYSPPKRLGLPNLTLTVHQGRVVAVDWQTQKTQKLIQKLTECEPQNLTRTPCQAAVHHDDNTNQDVLMMTMAWLDEYFAGRRPKQRLPLDFGHGTTFEQQVWQQLCAIEYGQTISYKQLAQQIGKPNAYRACANANGKNPISVLVPCHRVIAHDGSLGGYTGGVHIKRVLLTLEQAQFTS